MIRGLVRAFGGGLRAGSTSSYDAVSASRRIAGFLGSRSDINSLIVLGGEELRAKSHKAVREYPLASSAIDEWTSQAIGTGIKPQSRYLDPKGDRKKSRVMRRAIHELWADSSDEMDAAGITDIYGFLALAWRCMIESGEGFIRKRPRRASDGLLVPIQYQLLEPDHVPLTLNGKTASGNLIRAGIEFDQATRKKVAYWMRPEHPGSSLISDVASNEPRRVPADQVIHFFAPLRPGQLRGEPWFTKTLIRIWNLDQMDDATLERQKLGAMMFGWITQQTPQGQDPAFLNTSTATTDDGTAVETAPSGVEFGKVEPGTVMQFLERDEALNFFDPPDVGQNYEGFGERQERQIAQGVRALPHELLTGKITANFSAHRARTLAFRRLCEQLQHMVATFQIMRPIWKSWMDAAFLAGALDMPGYESNPRPYQRVAWRTPRWDWLDPLNDAKAEKLLIDELLKPRSASIQERGYDEEDVDEQIQADQERETEYGLIRRGNAANGALQQPDTPTPADEAKRTNQ